MGIDVSEELAASIFKAEERLEVRESRILGNIGICHTTRRHINYLTLKMETENSSESLSPINKSTWRYTRFSTLKMKLHILVPQNSSNVYRLGLKICYNLTM
jgi:hypothetical protein